MSGVYHRPCGVKPTIYAGVRYASRAEANRAAVLDLLQKAGEVLWLNAACDRFRLSDRRVLP